MSVKIDGITVLDNAILAAVKPDDETVNNLDNYQHTDEDLHLELAANSVYWVDLHLRYTATTTADLLVNLTLPAGASGFWAREGTNSADFNGVAHKDFGAVGHAIYGNSPTRSWCSFRGIVKTGASAGTLQLVRSQFVAQVSDATIHAPSALLAQKLA